MQFLSLSALSALVAVTGLVQAAPSAHAGADVLQRGSHHHRAIARDSRVARAAAGAVPPTLMRKGTKRDGTSTNRKCRIRPSQSSFIASPTSVPSVTGTVGNFNGTTASAAPTSSSDSATASPTGSTDGGDRGTPWYIVRKHQGSSFFDNWNFWSLSDPTHGAVNYQDAGSAWNKGLVSINGQGQAIMAVDTTPNTGGYRDSVRIHDDQFKFNTNTLILMDSTHMPTGCGTWPAFWSNGDNWPYQGEIDILEGINDNTQNQATLHTSSGCTAVPDSLSTGNLLGNNCDVTSGNNIGCGYVDSNSSNNYGQGFNDINGGVYAMQWVASGISIWFFPRNSIPSDITNEAPKPWTWPAPFAHWSASGCNPSQFFRDHYAIFDTTLCGDWAGSAWASGGCAEKTGYGSCQDFVANQGGAFQQAYWAVNYVKYFQQN